MKIINFRNKGDALVTTDFILLSCCKDRSFFDLNVNCLSSLLASEKHVHFNILIVESNPAWETLGLQYTLPNVKVIQPAEPFHYNRYCNIGLNTTHSDLVIFSNNDVVFHNGWLTEILNIRKKHPAIRSFCPFDRTSHYLKWEKYRTKEYHLGYRVPIEFVGWCFVIERPVFDLIGPFDENFDLYFQDNDFAMTLKKHGVLHAMVPSSYVRHTGGVTTGIADASKTAKYVQDREKFIAKWGKPSGRSILRILSDIVRP
jgi:GT2 family glycosyltransferase